MFLKAADIVAQSRRQLEILGADGVVQPLTHPHQLSLPLFTGAGPAGHLAEVVGAAFVSPLQQRTECRLERLVALGAAQQAVLSELRKGQAAVVAGQILAHLGSRTAVQLHEVGQQFVDWSVDGLERQAFLRGVQITEILGDFLTLNNLNRVMRGGPVTFITLSVHWHLSSFKQ